MIEYTVPLHKINDFIRHKGYYAIHPNEHFECKKGDLIKFKFPVSYYRDFVARCIDLTFDSKNRREFVGYKILTYSGWFVECGEKHGIHRNPFIGGWFVKTIENEINYHKEHPRLKDRGQQEKGLFARIISHGKKIVAGRRRF